MTEICYRSYIFLAKDSECFVGKRPVESVMTDIGSVERRPIPEEPDLHLVHEIKILAPAVIVTAFFQLIHTSTVDARSAILDTCRKHERRRHKFQVGFRIRFACLNDV